MAETLVLTVDGDTDAWKLEEAREYVIPPDDEEEADVCDWLGKLDDSTTTLVEDSDDWLVTREEAILPVLAVDTENSEVEETTSEKREARTESEERLPVVNSA